jgi:hypothetical protein
MSLRNRIILSVIALLTLAFLVGCGSSNSGTPPPSGAFSNANLSGTYVFSITGSDNASGGFQAITGTFSADGNGNVESGGAVDFNDSVADSAGTAITGGSYSVTQDGRGQAQLTVTNPIGGTTFTVDFVLSSSSGASGGLITQFDQYGTGSGTLALQSSSTQPAAGNYVVALTGVYGSGQLVAAYAGAVAIDGSNNITGALDYNVGGNSGICTITTGSAVTSTGATLNFTGCTSPNLVIDAYPVSTSDVKLISYSATQYPILSGDLFSQSSTSLPSGQLVFTLAGNDPLESNAPTVMAGLVTSDGSSTLSNGEEDFNDDFTSNITSSSSNPVTFTGTITPPGSGSRYLLTFNNFVTIGGGPSTWAFAAYPSDNGIILLEEDSSGGAIAGTAYAQSNTALAASTGYGMNLSGINNSTGDGTFEEDDIAEFTTTSSGFSGKIDMNDQTALSAPAPNLAFSGTYTALDSTADGRGGISSTTPDANTPNIDAVYYTVSPSQTVMVQIDSYQVGLGSLITQSGSSSSDLAQQHLATVRAVMRAKAMKAKKAAEKK